MIFYLRKLIHKTSSIKNKNIIKGILFVFCVGWLAVKSFTVGENPNGSGDLDTLSSEDKHDFLHKSELEMERRKEIVKDVCSREGLGKYKKEGLNVRHPPVPNYEAYFFDLDNKLMWCPIYKSASTSWLYNLCNLGGIPDDYIDNSGVLVIKIARNIYPSLSYKTAVEVIKDKIKFLIVRHPFARLLSAYRDKMEKVIFLADKFHETHFYYEKYGRKIVEKYRKFSSYGNKENIPNAEENKVKSEDDALSLKSFNSSRLEPTFEEFVMYITSIDLSLHADEHWIPYYLYCTPCLLDYDIIAKFETLDDDQRYIIEKSNLQGKLTPKWKRKSKGGLSSSIARKYFSEISKDLLLKLYEKYRIDIELFEYDINEYLEYVH